ncbi:MAG TPA: FAD-linked oxidase C-terminal domain-containing protein [Vicinamibacterales bacterium]|nr:FAD-linked oxidase C-terminal domain-containing protein [Vicinamibacterales bacterium]
MLTDGLVDRLREAVGAAHVSLDDDTRALYGMDGTGQGASPNAVVWPGSTTDVAAVARLCDESRTPMVPRGAGTGYSGGAIPVAGGVVLSLERLNRILEIDTANLLAVVEPHVVTGVLQAEVERHGLFYPPDPASLDRSVIGGNVAENAGGPRAFKYGVTRQYVLGLEAVLPTGQVIRTGGKTVKNVVGYDVTQLLVGSEGTLAILTEITLRLLPKPAAVATLRLLFPGVASAVDAVSDVIREGLIPAAIELVDRVSLEAVARHLGEPGLAPPGVGALLLIEVDGDATQVARDAARVEHVCRQAGAMAVDAAADARARAELWRVRRALSPALRTIAPHKFNHDVVVPRARVTDLMTLVERLARGSRLTIPCFGHAGDGNIHVNIMAPDEPDALARAREAETALVEGVLALEGSISGEHGIGLAKARFLGFELTPDTVRLMRRIKQAFDPRGILNPGKIFPSDGGAR